VYNSSCKLCPPCTVWALVSVLVSSCCYTQALRQESNPHCACILWLSAKYLGRDYRQILGFSFLVVYLVSKESSLIFATQPALTSVLTFQGHWTSAFCHPSCDCGMQSVKIAVNSQTVPIQLSCKNRFLSPSCLVFHWALKNFAKELPRLV
jgi:hypothetical protein